MFDQKNSHAARITGVLILVTGLMFYFVLREKETLPRPVVTATPTVTIVLPTRTPTHTPNPYEKAKAEYPELVTRVDRALKSLVVEFQPPVRNASDTGWLFPWQLTHFTPPVLTGVKGGQMDKSNELLPYRLILIFNIHPVGMDVSKGVFKVGIRNGQVEILDSEMPCGECEFSIQGWYHSRNYSQVTAWMPWQRFQAH